MLEWRRTASRSVRRQHSRDLQKAVTTHTAVEGHPLPLDASVMDARCGGIDRDADRAQPALRSPTRMSPDLTLALVIVVGVLIAMGLMVLSARESRRGGWRRDRS